ncbi:Transmembrane exosortase (Exosortase_EpsH) [Stieleria maiorica]|uniref:Transmembrane exosortase (Exosortase_EpsH) n=2 Tax=Stieleria maiorica TaxID=2795974 RepID=A0A5B9MIL9_9BACT|nr:Transmembrane exosortase (Exosortase_EpsH) [Stieleria maiorica]
MQDSPRPHYLAAVFWTLVLISPLPGVAIYLGWLSELDQYGYIIPLYVSLAALVLFRWDYRSHLPSSPTAIAVVAVSVLLNLVAAYRVSPWLSSISFAMAITAWLGTHRSSAGGTERLTYLSLLLLMTIRLPLNLDLKLTTSLQRMTSQVSSYLLDFLGVTHYLRGNVIELPGGTLFVEEACSGVQSLFTILFLVCLWMVYRRRPIMAAPAYLAIGILWAMVMNVVRINSVALAQEWYDTDLSSGTPHEILGWICLVIAALMVLSTDRLLRVLFFPVPADESGQFSNPVTWLWNRCSTYGTEGDRTEGDRTEGSEQRHQPDHPATVVDTTSPEEGGLAASSYGIVMLAGAALFCLPSLGLNYRIVATRYEQQVANAERPLLWDPDATLMNRTAYASAITDHEALRDANSKQLGHHADVWTMYLDGMAVRIAVSQPYPEWHDMRLCYSGDGWQVNDWDPTLEPIGESQDSTISQLDRWQVSYAEMVRDTGEFGTLLFCGLTRDGELVAAPMSGLYSLFDDRMKDRRSLQSKIMMLQLWTQTQKPLIPDQLEKLQSLFDSFRQTVLDELDGPNSISPADANGTNLTMWIDGETGP